MDPTAELTFLFTDIEGSTRLWEADPAAMREALVSHDLALRHAIEGHGGTVFKALGDAFFAVFPDPGSGFAAALAAQRRLAGTPWSEALGAEGLRVRMALNTGAAEARGGDYFGPPLNRVARLLAAAHGGQVLISQHTAELVRGALPEGANLADLGEHRLKDLSRPEHIFQAVLFDLPREFPPPRSLEAFVHNLPVHLTSFVGRERELAELKQCLAEARLLTVTGAAGCGKTRLAIQVAAEAMDTWKDGVWLVVLAPLTAGDLVPQTVAGTLGLREEPGRPLTQTLADFLHQKSLLLLLDNCEHLIPGCARLADALLQRCPHLAILASTREALAIPGERVYPLAPLPTPSPENLGTVPELLRHEAIYLFVERGRQSQPQFTLDSQNAGAVVQICHRLDGIPLAIELAAARVRVLTPDQIAARLDDRFRLLTGGSRTALPRQQALRAAVDWSYDLLSEAERAVLRRLSVFAGGWTLEAAEAVCSGGEVEEWEVLDLLSHLVDKSLVVAKMGSAETVPYRLLLTVRHYGHDRLLETGEVDQTRDRHRDWFLEMAREAEPHLQGARQAEWFNLVEADHDNFRAALEWSLVGDPDTGLKLASCLWRFWFVRGYFSEGRSWLTKVLSLGRPAPTPARARALQGVGVLALNQGDYEAARRSAEECLAIWRELNDDRGVAAALNSLGNVAWRHSDYAEAQRLYGESLEIEGRLGNTPGVVKALINLANVDCQQGRYGEARTRYEEALAKNGTTGNRVWETAILHNLGELAWDEGDHHRARELYQQSLVIRRDLGDRIGIARALNSLGLIAYQQGQDDEAQGLFEEALETIRTGGDRLWLAIILSNLGNVARRRGRLTEARELLEQSLAIHQELGNRSGIADTLNLLGGLFSALEQWERAAWLFGAEEALRETVHVPLPPVNQPDYQRSVEAARAAAGSDRLAEWWATGRDLDLPTLLARVGLRAGL